MIHKYRAWDTIKKKMWSAEEMGRDQLTLMPNGEGFINVSSTSTRLSSFLKHLTPLRFVGLKDKNEVEIYEGDIVKYSAFNEQKELQNYINPIFWEQNFASFSVGNEHSFWALSTCEDVEVIGNIYENPELLKK